MAGAAVLVLVSVGLQAGATIVDERRFPPPGELIDVGGHRLHVVCRNAVVSGFSGTVILDAGAGGWSLLHEGLVSQISDLAHVCSYDRAGLGASEEGPAPRTSAVMAEELKTLLEGRVVPKPYVLVGFSLGGYNTRVFAETYPNLVAGIVLAESAHERQWDELPHELRDLVESSIAGMRAAELMARLGILRLLKSSLGGEEVDPAVRQRYEAAMVRPEFYRTMIGEMGHAFESAAQVGRASDLGSRPLAVVTAGNSLAAFEAVAPDLPVADGNRVWARLQEEFLGLSTNSRQFLSVNSTHDIANDDPQMVVDAVRWVLESLAAGEKTDD